jgi:hypothetical protein
VTDAPAAWWRDGVYLRAGLWCDAQVKQAMSFVSNAQAPGRRHREVVTTEITRRLLGLKRALAVPFGRPFSFGALRLELIPAGHMPGAAQLLVEDHGFRTVYAGVVDPRRGAETRPCDALIIDAALGHTTLPPQDAELARLLAWVDDVLTARELPVLVLPLELLATVASSLAHPLRAHRLHVDTLRVLRDQGVKVPVARRLEGLPADGEVLLWPAGRALRELPRARVATAFGPDWKLAAQADAGALTAFIKETGATEIYLLRGDDTLASALGARLLGPPEQLDLVRL